MSTINTPSFFKFIVIGFTIASSVFGMNKQEEKIIDKNICLDTQTIQTKDAQIYCLCCSQDGKKIAFTNGSTLYIYDFKTGKLITKFAASWNSSKIKQLSFNPNFGNNIITYNDNDEKAVLDIEKNGEGTATRNQFGEKWAFCFGKNSWYQIQSIPHWSEICKANTSEIIVSENRKQTIKYKNGRIDDYDANTEHYIYSSNEDLCPLALYVQEKENSKDSIFIEILYNRSKNRKEINIRNIKGDKVKSTIIVDYEESFTMNPDCSLFAYIDSKSYTVKIFNTDAKRKTTLNIQCAPNSPFLFIDDTHLLVTNIKEEKHFLYVFNAATGECVQKIPSELITSLCLATEDTVLLGTTTGKIIYLKVKKTGMLEACLDEFSPKKDPFDIILNIDDID